MDEEQLHFTGSSLPNRYSNEIAIENITNLSGSEDIFGDSEDEEQQYNNTNESEILERSTLHIQRKHHSEGYLAGVTSTKDSQLQNGFNYGYPHGAQMGLAVGKILGILQAGNKIRDLIDSKQPVATQHNFKKIHDLLSTGEGDLTPKTLFSDKYYNNETTSLPKAVYTDLKDDDKPLDDVLKSDFPGDPSLHPSIKQWSEFIFKSLEIEVLSTETNS